MVPRDAYVHLYRDVPHLSPSSILYADGQCGTPMDCTNEAL